MAKVWRFRFLLDVWAEPREVDRLPAIVRGKVRELGADEEHYVGSLAQVEEIVEARLDDEGVTPRRWEQS